VIDGTFDSKAEAEKESKAQQAQTRQMEAVNSFMKPLRAGDFKGAVAAIDKLIATDQTIESMFGTTRQAALSHYDAPGANAYAKQLANGAYKDNPNALNNLAWQMVDDKTTYQGVDLKLAVKIAEKCVALTKDGDP